MSLGAGAGACSYCVVSRWVVPTFESGFVLVVCGNASR